VRPDRIVLLQPLRLHARLGITAPLALSVRLLARLVTIALKVARHLSAAQQGTLVLPVLLSVLFVARVLTVTRPELLVYNAQLVPIATQLALALFQLVRAALLVATV
jgi:hypothetical protein